MIIAFVSCSESIVNGVSEDTIQIDSIVIKNGYEYVLSEKDTVSVDVIIYPATVKLDYENSEGNKIYLLKQNGGNSSEPTEYKINRFEKLSTYGDNMYRFYISETDAGYGYRDTVRICYHNANYLVKSAPFEIKNVGTSLFSFSLSDGDTVWDSFAVKNDTFLVQVPNSFNLKSATAIFKHNGSGIFLNDTLHKVE